jgi:opacity protein-like surface antigen
MSRTALFTAASLMSLALPASALAQRADFPLEPQFAAKLMLGVAGEADIGPAEDDMQLTWGAGLHYLHPLMKYFAIGGQLSVQSWTTEVFDDSNADANVWVDLVLLPAGLLPVADNVQLQLLVPFGLTFDFWGEDFNGAEIETAVGFTIGVLAGVQFALSDSVGLLAEIGYITHSFEHDVEADGPLALGGEFDVDTGQLAIHLGAFF